ncbi:MAG: arginine--tRNA ligase [Bacteriovoracaceae bacterium]|nr:arginine--tRNA ligase [Bacteriovoracaceae bacterium]
MQTLHNPILKALALTIKDAMDQLLKDHNMDTEFIYTQIGEPPNLKMGHFAFPCFPLAKIMKNSPNRISIELAEKIQATGIIKEARPVGPYLNFFINLPDSCKIIVPSILSGDFFKQKILSKNKKLLVEYSQPNTHKELHVGHMRNVCLGTSIIKLNRYGGNEVIAANYIGDVGTHVAKCLWFLKYYNKENAPKTDKGSWIGKMYTEATRKLEKIKGTPEEETAKNQITDILKQLEAKSGEFYELWQQTRKWSLDLFQDAYKWADAPFDKYYYESDVDSSSLELARELYKKGFYVESEGAIGMDLSKEKLGFAIMIKSDGTGMYATKDIKLAKEKFEEFNPDISYYIVDKRQEFHFKQVFKVLEKIGFQQAKNCHHLQYDFVELPDGAMSSRNGNIVPLSSLIKQMESTIKTQFLNRYKDDWSIGEINSTAHIIAGGAIKYGMLRMDSQRKIVFDMNEWLKLDGETGPYLQYVHARIHSMCEKFSFDSGANIDWTALTMPQEEAVFLKLIQFNSIIQTSIESHKTSNLCSYLYELGKLFNNFYAACPIGKAPDEKLKLARLALSKSVAIIMKQGMALLGITSPSRM